MVLAEVACAAVAGRLCAGVEDAVVAGCLRLCGLAGVAASEEHAMAESASAGRIAFNTTLIVERFAPSAKV